MKAYDLIELAWRNLRESVLRNGLTTAGIAVGVASLVAMMSLGVGLQQLASRRLSGSGLFDTVVVSPERETQRNRSEPAAPEAGPPRVLDEAARQEIARLPNVLEAQPEIRFLSEVRFGDRTHIVSIGGLAPSASENEAFENMTGRFFSSSVAREAIVRDTFARQLNEKEPGAVIGQDLILDYAERHPLNEGNRAEAAPNRTKQGAGSGDQNGDDDFGFNVVRRQQTLRIVGMIANEPYGGMRASSQAVVFMPTQLAEDLNIMQASDLTGAARSGGSSKTYASVMARVSDPGKVQAVEDAIRKMGYRTFSILDASQGLRRFFTVLDLFLGIFGSLALAVASLGIINTLVMAVLERRREIGILKAIGASDGDVEKLFFAEAGAMGLIGGVFGVLLASGIGAAINFGTAIYLRRHQLPAETVWSAPGWLMMAAIAFAVLVSLASGLYPARRAAKLDPVQALRYE